MHKPLNWAILGTSFISGVMADAIQKDATSHIYAVAGRTPETLNKFARQYNIPKQYQDFDACISDENVDIVYIALPNHLHSEWIIKAANAGKAILCEKSLCVDMHSTQKALSAVNDNQVFFAEGLMYLHHPLANKIQQLISPDTSTDIGEIRSIQAHYCAAISQFTNPGSQGALFNLGCYPISLMHLVLASQFGQSIFANYQVIANGRLGKDGNICESSAVFSFNSPSCGQSIQASISCAEDYGLDAGFSILGSKGYIKCASNPWLPDLQNTLIIGEYEQTPSTLKVAADGNGFDYQVKHILEALHAGKQQFDSKQSPASIEDSRQIMQLLCDWHEQASI